MIYERNNHKHHQNRTKDKLTTNIIKTEAMTTSMKPLEQNNSNLKALKHEYNLTNELGLQHQTSTNWENLEHAIKYPQPQQNFIRYKVLPIFVSKHLDVAHSIEKLSPQQKQTVSKKHNLTKQVC